MSNGIPYRRTYEDARVEEAYRLYVDGKATQREIRRLTGFSERSIARYSKRDGWLNERHERERSAAHGSVVATIAASVAVPAGETLDKKISELMNSEDVRERIGAVLCAQRSFWDRLAEDLRSAYEEAAREAASMGERLSASQLFPFVALGEKVSAAQRKAHGIPDVSRLELEAKTDTAHAHAEVIRRRREERLQRSVN